VTTTMTAVTGATVINFMASFCLEISTIRFSFHFAMHWCTSNSKRVKNVYFVEPETCKDMTCPEQYHRCESSGRSVVFERMSMHNQLLQYCRCIPFSWKCDGDRDCGENDDSDEPKTCRKFV
jgi:hypothetical protein